MQEIIPLVIAAVLVFGLYKLLKLIVKAFDDSGFKSFMLSFFGKVLLIFISVVILFSIYAFVMVNIVGIRC